jgi:hypothetical protein
MIEQGSDLFDKKKQTEKLKEMKKKEREEEIENKKKYLLF